MHIVFLFVDLFLLLWRDLLLYDNDFDNQSKKNATLVLEKKNCENDRINLIVE